MVANMQPREGYVVLKYNGLSQGTRVYRGPGTKTNYRFGNNPAHRMSYVYQEDVDHLLALSDGGRPLFELVKSANQQASDSPTLVAAGPPPQEVPGVEKVATGHTGTGPPVVEEILGTVDAAGTESVAEDLNLQEYSVSELRKGVGDWPMEKAALYLAYEKARPEPRTSAITLLQRRLQQGGSDWTG